MNQPKPKRRRGWYWTGVGLLIGSAPLWWLAISAIFEPEVDAGGLVLLTAILASLTGVGIFCVRRGRGAGESPTLKQIERRRRWWDTLQWTFFILAVAFWVVFNNTMSGNGEGIPIGYLVVASIFTGMTVLCYSRKKRYDI